MEDTIVRIVFYNPLPQMLLYTAIRGVVLLGITWCVLPWKRDEFSTVLLWVALALLASTLTEMGAVALGWPPLAGKLAQAAAETLVLSLLLLARRMGWNHALTLLPSYLVALVVTDFLFFE